MLDIAFKHKPPHLKLKNKLRYTTHVHYCVTKATNCRYWIKRDNDQEENT